MWGCVARGGKVDSYLMDGVVRRPESDELGPYAEFFLDQENLPLLRRFSSEGIIHWLAQKGTDERSTGILSSPFQQRTVNELYYSNRSSFEDRGWYKRTIGRIPAHRLTTAHQFGFLIVTILLLWVGDLSLLQGIYISCVIILISAVLHAATVDGWNKGIEKWTDIYTNIPEAAWKWTVGAGGIFLIGTAIDWYAFGLSVETNFGKLVGVWEGLLATWGMVSLRYTSRDKSNDKLPFLNFIKKRNEEIIAESLKALDDEGTKDAWRKGFSNLAYNTLIVKHPDLRFPDGDKSEYRTISRKERYHLALLRKNGLWDDFSKTASYAKWLGWSEEDIETHRKEDGEISTDLARYIENRTEADLHNGLARVMGEEQVLQYLPGLVGNPEFWLKREVTVKTNESDSGEKESFLQWVDRVICSPGVHYLVSEAAKGKSTTLNLLTLHHVNSESGIWPLRVKLRELYLRTPEQPLIQRVREFYKINADKRFNYVEERFDAVMDGDATPPLLILDGLDELPPRNQIELLDELKNESWPIPILVVTRPDKRILGRGHAVLGKMTGQQRVEVLRNLDLDPEVLRQMENLPEALIDRPFALLIAAEKIRVERTSSLEAGDINLSLSEISKMYEENYFEREAEKKSWLEKLGDNLSYVEPIKDALNHLAIHHIRHHAPPQRNDPAVVEREEFLDAAVKLKIIDDKLNLIDGWLTGYYAARSPDFEIEAWNAVLEDVYQNPDRSELIIRYFVASTPAEHTPNWDAFGLDAPVVMDIASQEWLAMDRSSRKSMMRRFGIPHDDKGRLDFPPDHDFMECELPELLALLHFHCSIADTEGWHSPEETIDTQWEQLFTALTMRYYGELKDKLGEDEELNFGGRKFALGESLYADPVEMEDFLEELFGESYTKGINRVRKLVPYNHNRDSRSDTLFDDVMYSGNATPSPLLRVIEGGLGGSIDELQSLKFAVGMIEVHALMPLFKLSRVVLEKFVPCAYEIQGEPWHEVRIMLHRIIGYRKNHNIPFIGKCKGMQFPESNLGIPLEITIDEDFSIFSRTFESDEQFLPLERKHGPMKLSGRSYVNDELRVFWARGARRKTIESGIGVKILEDVSINPFLLREPLSTLIVPDNHLYERKTEQLQNLSKKLLEVDDNVKRLKKLNAEKSHQESHKLLKANSERKLVYEAMLRMEKELELHRSGEDLRSLAIKEISPFLPSCDEQTTALLTMLPWDGYTNVLGGYLDKPTRKQISKKWEDNESKEYWATLPSEDSRLIRMIKVPVRLFITPRLKLQWMMPKPHRPYLVSFRGGGFAADTELVANVVSLNFSKGILYWIIGREGRTRGSCVYRQPNTDLAEIYREFMEIDNRRFQPLSAFEDIDKKLDDLRKTGKVSVYLKSNEEQIGDKTHRVLLVPETEWQNRDFTDLKYDIRPQGKLGTTEGGEIEQAFSSIYSVIPGSPEDAHLNRWYAVDFVLGSDDSGERHLFPDHKTIEPLCQLCAAETIEIKGDPEQFFICDGCSEWYLKPQNEEK